MTTNPTPFAATARLKAGHASLACWCSIPSALLAESIAAEGFETLIFDMQHSTQDYASIRDGIVGARLAGKTSAVRIALGDFTNAARFLDSGADIVIAPMINTVEDAKAYVSAVKYIPVGDRSWGPTRAMQLTGLGAQDYLTRANAETLAFAMIETREALANVEAILSVPGIDGAFIGPSDLSISLLDGKRIDATGDLVKEAMNTVLKAAKKTGKLTGCYSATLDMAKWALDNGWGLVSVTTDATLIRDAAKASLAAMKG